MDRIMLNPLSRVLARTIAACSLLAGVALLFGCAEALRVQSHPGLRELKTPIRNMKGNGEAIHNWKSDQNSATPSMNLLVRPPGLRPPVSAEATRSSS